MNSGDRCSFWLPTTRQENVLVSTSETKRTHKSNKWKLEGVISDPHLISDTKQGVRVQGHKHITLIFSVKACSSASQIMLKLDKMVSWINIQEDNNQHKSNTKSNTKDLHHANIMHSVQGLGTCSIIFQFWPMWSKYYITSLQWVI